MKKENKNIKQVSVSLFRKRWRRFKIIKRGYYSFLIILFLYIISFILPVFIGRNALLVKYNEQYCFPLFKYYSAGEFNQNIPGEANYRLLKKQFKEEGKDNFVLMPLYPYGPNESLLDETEGNPPHPPTVEHIMGTDTSGRDVFARLLYGLNVSISFALTVTLLAFLLGIIVGAVQGFFGGIVDILIHRFIEIWSTLPVLYVIIIVSSLIVPNFFLLCLIMTVFSWVGISFYMRGEFYRERGKDYVSAAIAMGATNRRLIFSHILPNSLTPIISFAPFAIVGNIAALVSLDFLGFGLPPPTPSWGQLIQQGMTNVDYWWLVAFPLGAEFLTLIAIVFIGEAVREAFDPKPYSRLR
jgi:microcin C transport system permease protein